MSEPRAQVLPEILKLMPGARLDLDREGLAGLKLDDQIHTRPSRFVFDRSAPALSGRPLRDRVARGLENSGRCAILRPGFGKTWEEAVCEAS